MNEKIGQSTNQTRNLSLEETESKAKLDANSIRQKEIQANAEVIEKDGKKFFRLKKDSEEYNEYKKINDEVHEDVEKITNISEYKMMASPKFEDKIDNIQIPDEISEIEKAEVENEKRIEETKKNIEDTANKLNELRQKLGMEATDDIPSLIVKKEKLSTLLIVQNELESKLSFEKQKSESINKEQTENKQRENNNLNVGIEEVSSNLRKLASLIEERQSKGYQNIFSAPDGFKSVASGLVEFTNKDDLKSKLFRLGSTVEDFAPRGINDTPDSMREVSSKLKQLLVSLQEFSSKIQNEEERKEFSGSISSVIDKVDMASNRISKGADLLQDYLNVRM